MSFASDPYAWLLRFYTPLQAEPGFSLLAPSQQFAQLCDAVAVDHPAEAADMRAWSAKVQRTILEQLALSSDKTPPKVTSELWRVTKDRRQLRCVAQYLASGIDLRLLEGDGFRRTQLCKNAADAESLSQQWRQALLEKGWEPLAVVKPTVDRRTIPPCPMCRQPNAERLTEMQVDQQAQLRWFRCRHCQHMWSKGPRRKTT